MFQVSHRIFYSNNTTGVGIWRIDDTLQWQKFVREKFNEALHIMDSRLVEIFPTVYSVHYCDSLIGYVQIKRVKKEGD